MTTLPPLTRESLAELLGTDVSNVVSLALVDGALRPEHLDFLGLVHARRRAEPAPDAVVLRDGQPLLYIWDMRHHPELDAAQRHRDLERLALRSDAPYVAILRPGVVQLYALSQTRANRLNDVPLLEADELHPGLIANLGVGNVPAHSSGVDTHGLMLELLNVTTRQLIRDRGVLPDEALALVGRALFLRFLHDRGIVSETKPITGVPDFLDCFATVEHAVASCRWLDETFNGDLLPLPGKGDAGYFERISSCPGLSALDDLSAIIRGDKPVGDGAIQTQFSWNDLHFSYIPVGLLSQVYQHHIHLFEAVRAKRDSVYYTPRHLAEYVVDHAFAMLGHNSHLARVLDPAAGGGVFLLAALRRLVQGRWRATGQQPTTKVIRHILNTQVVGIDTNPAARQLSALALYLTALELDPNLENLSELKFDALQGHVLLAAEEWVDAASGLALGSLSRPWPADLDSAFDVVLGNPPWTSAHNPWAQRAMDANARQDMQARGITPVKNPDSVPDLPFVWAATRWAKPGAIIAFALHARILIKNTGPGYAARRALFEGIDVTYVLNGLELRNTEVWPDIAAQFCLLFGRNQPADNASRFYAVTPVLDRNLNKEGRVRIDSKDVWASDLSTVAEIPYLFKALAKGNALDVELLEKIRIDRLTCAGVGQNLRPTLSQYADQVGIREGQGYQVTSRTQDAAILFGLPMMPDPREIDWLVVPTSKLAPFTLDRVHRVRSAEIYRAPLVLLRKSPSSRGEVPVAMLAESDVAFRESYFGYSCASAESPDLMAKYLLALLNSGLFLYYTLMTSNIFGVERSAMQKSDADQFPVIPLAQLTSRQITVLNSLLDGVVNSNWRSRIDAFVNDIYALTPADRVLIEDRLATSLPFAAVQKSAISVPSVDAVQHYLEALGDILRPFDLSTTPLVLRSYPTTDRSPWRFFSIGGHEDKSPPNIKELLSAIKMADGVNSTLVEYRRGKVVYVGVLDQRRYWTRTSARTLALDLIKRHDSVLYRGAEMMLPT